MVEGLQLFRAVEKRLDSFWFGAEPSRAAVAAALARAVRFGVLDQDGSRRAQRRFSREWPDIARVPVGEALVLRAGTERWRGTTGCVATTRSSWASALTWQDSIGQAQCLILRSPQPTLYNGLRNPYSYGQE
jgi:hypothetical protein